VRPVVSRLPLARTAAVLLITIYLLSGVAHASGLGRSGAASAEANWGSRARLTVETGVQIHSVGSVAPTGIVLYDPLVLNTIAVSLTLSTRDDLEWDLNLSHLPKVNIALLGATARIKTAREALALLSVTRALPLGQISRPVEDSWSWGAGLEWRRIMDPIALSARLGCSGNFSAVPVMPSAEGSVALLINDYVSLSGSFAIGRRVNAAVDSTLGASLAYKLSELNTVYVKLRMSLTPTERISVSVGFSREL
jgi:hypothetical protein